MKSLRAFLNLLSPDSKIDIVRENIIFSGYAGEAMHSSKLFNAHYDVVGTKLQFGTLAIYVL